MPGLLDSIMADLVTPSMVTIIELIKKNNVIPTDHIRSCLDCIFQIQYIVVKVRGFKTAIKFYPSSVDIFELVIHFLVSLEFTDQKNTYSIYVLSLWVAVLGLVPFDIDTIDTDGTLINKLINYLKNIIFLSGSIREIACFSLSKLLNRPDLIRKSYQSDFLSWGIDAFQNDLDNLFVIVGVFNAIFELIKNSQSADILEHSERIMANLVEFRFPNHLSNSGIILKFKAKIAQRIGANLLKSQNQGWKYNSNDKSNKEIPIDYLTESKFELLESVVEFLLDNLEDKEYIVRWSCAKGLGRICERLTKDMAEDILREIFLKFENLSDYSFHGGCLAIGEMAKRGIVLPKDLDQIIGVLEKALIFETNMCGTYSSGGLVRDAGCYVVWSLARAYTVAEMQPFVTRLSKKLMLTILFDKEVNCRRAASAAFQECVGRQGSFPHGIEILTEADYFTLGNKIYCYLNIAPFISQYEEYFEEIMDFLVTNRLLHTNAVVRQLAAESINLICCFNPVLCADKYIPILLKNSCSPMIDVRQGSIVGLGYLLTGLKGKWDFERRSFVIRKKLFATMTEQERELLEDSEYRKKFEDRYNTIKFNDNSSLYEKHKEEIGNLFAVIDELGLYKGKGNEVMRQSLNSYVKLLNVAEFPLSQQNKEFFYQQMVDNFTHRNIKIQLNTIQPFKLINQNIPNVEFFDGIVIKIMNHIETDVTDYIPRGFVMAVSHINSHLLSSFFPKILSCLHLKLQSTDSDTRKYSLQSIFNLACRVIKQEISNDSLVEQSFEIFFKALEDYEIDPKFGDVGAKSREESIISLTEIIILLGEYERWDVVEKYLLETVKKILKQGFEKFNRIRLVSHENMQKLLYSLQLKDKLSILPHSDVLAEVYLKEITFNEVNEIFNLDWQLPEYGFERAKPLIKLANFQYDILSGMIISIGGLTEDVQRCSLKSLIWYLETEGESVVSSLMTSFKRIFVENEKVDRVIVPLIVTLTFLLSRSEFIQSKMASILLELGNSVVKECAKTKNVTKLISSIDVYYNLLFVPRDGVVDLYPKVLKRIIMLLAHKYPVVRKVAAEKMFVLFSSIMDDPEPYGMTYDELDEVMIFLGEIDWSEELEVVKQKRKEVAEMLKIEIN